MRRCVLLCGATRKSITRSSSSGWHKRAESKRPHQAGSQAPEEGVKRRLEASAHKHYQDEGMAALIHKAEHAVDLGTGAIVAVMLHGTDEGDTRTTPETAADAGARITTIVADTDNDEVAQQVSAGGPREVVSELSLWGVRTCCSEPDRGR